MVGSVHQETVEKSFVIVHNLLQDVRDCDGPIERLHELNGNIRDVVTELKSRIQVCCAVAAKFVTGWDFNSFVDNESSDCGSNFHERILDSVE